MNRRLNRRRILVCAALGASFLLGPRALAAGVHAQAGYEHLVVAKMGERSASAPGAFADLALALPMGSESRLLNVGLRAGRGEEGDRIAPHAFLRVLAGHEEWKTFFDLGVLARLQPSWSVGPRMGIGAAFELGGGLAIYAIAGGATGFGSRFHVAFDGGIGLQLRFGGETAPLHYDYVH